MLLPTAVMAIVCSLMMFPMTNHLYLHVPLLKFAVFAWRYLFVLSFASAVFVCAGLEYRETRTFAVIGAALLLVGWFALWPPSHYRDADATWNSSFNQRTAMIGPYFDHMPLTVPPNDFQRFATFPIVTVLSDRSDPSTSVQVTQWNTELRRIRFNSPQPTALLIRLIYFPGWQAEIDGRPVPIQADTASGFVRVNVQGTGELVLRYRWTPARKLGWSISLLAIFATLACARWRRQTQQSGNPKAAAV